MHVRHGVLYIRILFLSFPTPEPVKFNQYHYDLGPIYIYIYILYLHGRIHTLTYKHMYIYNINISTHDDIRLWRDTAYERQKIIFVRTRLLCVFVSDSGFTLYSRQIIKNNNNKIKYCFPIAVK
jgi:hypothetical protein